MLFTKMATIIIPMYSILFYVSGTAFWQNCHAGNPVLLFLQLVKHGDEVSQCDECSRSEHEDKRSEIFRIDRQGEYFPGPQQLPDSSQQCQGQGKSKTDTQSIEGRCQHVVSRCKGLGATQHDA